MNASSTFLYRNQTGVSFTHNAYLDWMRGTAAILVLTNHIRGTFFEKWANLDLESQNSINFFLFLITRLGRESVVIFFVMSGYLVGGQSLVNFLCGSFSFRSYIISRIARLYTVIVPALLLTMLLDSLDSAWNNARNGPYCFFTNLLFLQNIIGPPYGTNAPFWSLSYEWWFYVLFGLGLFAATRPLLSLFSVLANLLILIIIYVLIMKCNDILLMLPLWILGAFVKVCPRNKIPIKIMLAFSLTLFFIGLVISSYRWDRVGDYIVGITTAALIFVFRDLQPPKQRWFSIGKSIASFSFSLYALHYPINCFMEKKFLQHRSSHAGVLNWICLVVISLGVTTLCYAFYWTFERHTRSVRVWLLYILPNFSRPLRQR